MKSAQSLQPSALVRPAVLAVDDVHANLVALRAVLEDMDCEVVFARSGSEALRHLLHREFAVMLLDVQMPEMDGYEVAHHARRNPSTRDLPIIFLTAANDNEVMVLRGYGSGAVDFLFKPLNATILCSKVRIFVELHAARRKVEDAKASLERKNRELESAYRELTATHSQLVQSAKMASLGELVAGVAHEINNPLSFVLSHLETVRRSLAAVEPELSGVLSKTGCEQWRRAGERLSQVGPGLERIRELVVKLRTFSRLDEGETKLVSIRECVESVLTILGHRLRSGVALTTHFGEPDEIECYPSLLNQAIMNLVGNAIDAVDGKGEISIATGAQGDSYAIVVRDSGPGIPAELKTRIFEPFFTTKPVGQGTGLGLSISYSIAQKHGGALELRDPPSGGAEIAIRFPLSQRQAR